MLITTHLSFLGPSWIIAPANKHLRENRPTRFKESASRWKKVPGLTSHYSAPAFWTPDRSSVKDNWEQQKDSWNSNRLWERRLDTLGSRLGWRSIFLQHRDSKSYPKCPPTEALQIRWMYYPQIQACKCLWRWDCLQRCFNSAMGFWRIEDLRVFLSIMLHANIEKTERPWKSADCPPVTFYVLLTHDAFRGHHPKHRDTSTEFVPSP